MPDRGGVRSRRLAGELRRLRDRRGLTGDEVARTLGWSGSKVSRIELLRTGLRPEDLERLMDLYQVDTAHREALLSLAREPGRRARPQMRDNLTVEISTYMDLEAEADLVWNWEPQVVPGLLQTERYARSMMRGFQRMFNISSADLERRVLARLARQQLLTTDDPPEVLAVIDESVLHRRFGDTATMHAQLIRLIEASQLPHVNVHIMPLGTEPPIGTGSFTYMRFAQVYDVPLPDLVVFEQLVTNYLTEGEEDTNKYRVVFERLVDTSLAAGPSRDLISSLAQQLWS